MSLTLFTDPIVIRHVSRILFADFFAYCARFSPGRSFLPNPASDNDSFPVSLAETVQDPERVPAPFLDLLCAIEAAATPESGVWPTRAYDPDIDDSKPARLDLAIRAWIAAQRQNQQPPPAPVPKPAEGQPTPTEPCETRPPLRAPATSPDPQSLAPHSDLDIACLRLARLTPAQYERVRRAEALHLHVRPEQLDAQVLKCRASLDSKDQTPSVRLPDINPWPDPVDGAAVLADVSASFTRFLCLPRGAADALALWTAHTHALAAFHISPRLSLHSLSAGCGKTTALDVLATMVPRPLRTENLSPAVLFRLVHQHQPTLLLDEVDAYLPQSEELRGLLNAGHKRGACAYRCEGEGNAVRAFNAFAPAALAGLGSLPATLRDRSVLIPLVSANPGQIPARFDPLRVDTEHTLARKLARWAKDNLPALTACDPPLPQTAFNRLADNWRPLLAIAHVAAAGWPTRALDAFNRLAAKPKPRLDDTAPALLADLRAIFAQSAATRLSSRQLVQALRALPDRSWSPVHNGAQPINERWLSRHLRPFGVAPRNLRLGGTRAKGYELADFDRLPPDRFAS